MDTVLKEKQLELEHKYNKNQLMKRVKSAFKCEDFDKLFEEQSIPPAFGYELLAVMAIQKRANVPTLVGVLNHHYEKAQDTADMLTKCVEADLVDFDSEAEVFIAKYLITPDVQRELDYYQFPLPMIVPPKKVYRNNETGYLASGGSLILKNNYHEEDICLDHINRMNHVQLKLDMDTAKMVNLKWRNLDKPKDGETWQDYQDRMKAFKKYQTSTMKVMEEINDSSDCFYMTWAFDKRGRSYSRGYHINIQGVDWNKAVINFYNEEVATK